jgi:formimidoylglutamate deiminase
MPAYLAPHALLPHGWEACVRIEVEPDGNIVSVRPGADGGGCERLAGPVVAGMPDLHSHAFQRAMAGLVQRLEPAESTFWGWRQAMYRFLEVLTPDDVRTIAAQLYVELLKGGYTSVAEFHYLHNAPDGDAYADPAVMSLAIHEAAREAGIGLTLLPCLYMTGGFDGRGLEGGQRRFRLDADGLFRLLERLDTAFRDDPARKLGIAPHSLRAAPLPALRETVAELRRRDPTAPIHIHVAEQVREVEECLAHTGRRPFRLLTDSVRLDAGFCLIHVTHLDDGETAALAASPAVAGLCPTTEADLGDGFFRLADHLEAGGRIGIGTDSQACTVAAEELRLMEYAQRLQGRRRLVAATPAEPSTGARLWRAALAGGAQAVGQAVGRIAPGFRADLLVLDADHPSLVATPDDRLLDALVFAPGPSPIRDVMVGGAWKIRDGGHALEVPIANAYRAVLRRVCG